jgi:WD40 repeat protein
MGSSRLLVDLIKSKDLGYHSRSGLYTLSGHTQGIIGVAFSPDGTHVATVSFDGTARIWDVTPAKELLYSFCHPD